MSGLSKKVKNLFASLAVASVLALAAKAFSAQADWKKDWEQTLAAAKKEGQVTIYIYRYEGLLQDFKREYPGITVQAVTGRGSEMSNRIMAERRAGKFITDVYSGGTNSLFNTLYKGKALDPLKPLLVLPEVTDTSKWYGNEHRYADPEGKYIFAFIGSASSSQLSYNTNLVNPKEFKSYTDLINPKWKGKIVALDPRDTGLGATMQFYFYSPQIGPEYMKKFFGGMDNTYAKNWQQMTNWLAQGKFAICMGCKDSQRAKNQGLPVDDFDTTHWKEGSSFSAGGGSMAYMNQAPHPNAAKVFLNWFLSRKGQIALQKLGDVDDPANSRRIDIPKDDILPDNRLQPGVKYFDVVKPEYGDMKPIFDLAKEIMAGVEKGR
jgi:iron(III) transport system substrate-binding protein